MKCEDELNSGSTLRSIVDKLPDDIKRRWLTKNFEITESGRLPKLDDVFKLVETETTRRSDPVFGNLLTYDTSSKTNSIPNNFNTNLVSKPKTRQSFATSSSTETKSTKDTSIKCIKCNDTHYLNQCSAFRAMSVPARLTFVRQNKLCLNCFMKDHISEFCTHNLVCKVPGCGKKHNSWLHSALSANNNDHNNNYKTTQLHKQATVSAPATNDQPQVIHVNSTRKSIEPQQSKIALPIIPVVVSNQDNQLSMHVFALLDSGSNGTFCSKRLISALRLKTHNMNFKLSTLESKNLNIDTLSVNLRVEDTKRQSGYLISGVLCRELKKFLKLDDPACINDNLLSVTDKQVIKLWNEHSIIDGDHYSLPIPFKEHPPRLPNNYAVAKHRLDLLGKRLVKNPDLKHKYVQRTSLNDCINQGLELTNKLIGVLLRFRQGPIAINADIEGMFNQVKVPVHERDVLRFLWWKENDPDKSPKHYHMTTHLFGGVWSPRAANFALQRVAEDNKNYFSELTTMTVKHNCYVDDCLKSVPTESIAIKLAAELRELLARGGFKFTKWLSNSKEVMKSIPTNEWAKSLHELNLDKDYLPYYRTLGVLWNIEKDCFTFDTRPADKPLTQRGVLSITSSIYDPLGFAGPFVLNAKALFQELCHLKIDWDKTIPTDIAT
ncbi:uncharacterized protein LOC144360065 [Saccoglossus kowalevskii]